MPFQVITNFYQLNSVHIMGQGIFVSQFG